MSNFNRPSLIAWFFFIGAMVTTIGLGTWQVERLAWKEGLIARIEAAKHEAPLTTMPETEAELQAKNFYPVAISGHWVKGQEFDITPRFFNSTLGYFIITPLMLDDGRTLLVNRGWVPTKQKDPATRPGTGVQGRATVHGMIRYGNERSWFTPKNSPERNVWFGRDIDAMAEFGKLPNPVPAMVDVVGTQDINQLPVPSDGAIRLRNDHLSYIITWYGIAAGILLIFILSHRKKA